MLIVEMASPADFDVRVFFLRTELELGLTFASIAGKCQQCRAVRLQSEKCVKSPGIPPEAS
jgi:hypothetical protein